MGFLLLAGKGKLRINEPEVSDDNNYEHGSEGAS
jgi:hypothetical protein